MPLVRISLNQGTSPEFRRRLGDAVHRAMVETINVPLGDRFQLITEHEPGGLVYDPSYPNITRTDRWWSSRSVSSRVEQSNRRSGSSSGSPSAWTSNAAFGGRTSLWASSKYLGRTGRSDAAKRSMPTPPRPTSRHRNEQRPFVREPSYHDLPSQLRAGAQARTWQDQSMTTLNEPGRCPPGPTSRPEYWPAATIGCSRSTFSAGSSASGSGSRLT
jgi:hypothetical protein